MSAMGDRLREARVGKGFRSAAEAAEALGINPSTYRAHENGQNDFDVQDAGVYSRKFGVSMLWLLDGKDRSELKRLSAQMNVRQDDVLKLGIPELETRAGAGLGGDGNLVVTGSGELAFSEDAVKHYLGMPDDFLGQIRAHRTQSRIIEVMGDSMYNPSDPGAPGSIYPGDRVIVDTSDKLPSPAGAFAVWDGLGIVVKMVEVVQGSDPTRIRMISRNPQYSPYEATAEEAVIIGRIKARITEM